MRRAVLDGDVQNGSVMTGQICGLVNEMSTVEEVIKSMFAQAAEVCTNLDASKLV